MHSADRGGFSRRAGQPVPVVLFVSLLTGTAVGLLTGIIISRGKVQAFIATLVTMTIMPVLPWFLLRGNL